jgi:hypothetical protein
VNAEKKQLRSALDRAQAVRREIEELVAQGAVTNSKAIAVLRKEEGRLKAYTDSKLEEFDALGRECMHHRNEPLIHICADVC